MSLVPDAACGVAWDWPDSAVRERPGAGGRRSPVMSIAWMRLSVPMPISNMRLRAPARRDHDARRTVDEHDGTGPRTLGESAGLLGDLAWPRAARSARLSGTSARSTRAHHVGSQQLEQTRRYHRRGTPPETLPRSRGAQPRARVGRPGRHAVAHGPGLRASSQPPATGPAGRRSVSNGTANTSCSTKATRCAGESRSSTTSSALLTDSGQQRVLVRRRGRVPPAGPVRRRRRAVARRAACAPEAGRKPRGR